ncbi:xylose isomerase-like TIM barrel [Peptococcaceae bacterium CEB3]|nr:xylose isomerase-like TIM barrel [Peptococcaceae bacterium CEB3]
MKWTLSAFGDEIAPDLETQLKVLSKNGIRYLELRSVDGKDVLALDDRDLREIRTQLRKNGVGISAIGSPIGKVPITEPFAATLRSFERVLAVAKALETSFIRMFSFFVPREEVGSRRDEVMARIGHLTERAEKEKIVLLHENEKEIFGDTPERCLDILRTVNSPFLRATFDPANFLQVGVEPFPQAYYLLQEWIVYYHVKDALAGGGQVCPAGKGDARYPDFLREVAQAGFEGFFSIEPHLAEGSQPGGGEEKFSQAVKSFRELVSAEKEVILS